MSRAVRVPAAPPGDLPGPDVALELPAAPDAGGEQQTIPGTAPKGKRGRGRPRKESAPTAPGADRPPKTSATTRAVGRPTVAAKLETRLGAELVAVAKIVSLIDKRDGETILEHAPDIAESWARLADQNPRVKKLLDAGTSGSAWFGVIVSTGGLALALAGNHGIGLLAPPTPPAPSSAPAPDATVFDFANLNEQAAARARAAANGTG